MKWEYMVWIVVKAADLKSGGGKIRYINYREIKNWEMGLPIFEALQQAGRDGWELVQIEDTSIYYFKRPLQG